MGQTERVGLKIAPRCDVKTQNEVVVFRPRERARYFGSELVFFGKAGRRPAMVEVELA